MHPAKVVASVFEHKAMEFKTKPQCPPVCECCVHQIWVVWSAASLTRLVLVELLPYLANGKFARIVIKCCQMKWNILITMNIPCRSWGVTSWFQEKNFSIGPIGPIFF